MQQASDCRRTLPPHLLELLANLRQVGVHLPQCGPAGGEDEEHRQERGKGGDEDGKGDQERPHVEFDEQVPLNLHELLLRQAASVNLLEKESLPRKEEAEINQVA